MLPWTAAIVQPKPVCAASAGLIKGVLTRLSSATASLNAKSAPEKGRTNGTVKLYVICTSYARHLHVKNFLFCALNVLLNGAS